MHVHVRADSRHLSEREIGARLELAFQRFYSEVPEVGPVLKVKSESNE